MCYKVLPPRIIKSHCQALLQGMYIYDSTFYTVLLLLSVQVVMYEGISEAT